MIHIIPFMMIPVTMDYLKRDYYTQTLAKENQALDERRKVVQAIIKEKKRHVSFE